jgi:hypothetical protein
MSFAPFRDGDQLILVRRLALGAQACQDGEITVDLLNRHLAVIRLLNSQRLTLSRVSRQRLKETDPTSTHHGPHDGLVLR